MRYFKHFTRPVLVLGIAVALGACNKDEDETTTTPPPATPTNVQKAIAVLEAIESGDVTAMQNYVDQTTYIQHNLSFPDGIAPVIGAIQAGVLNGTIVDTYRSFSDGDVVVLHSKYSGTWNMGAPQAAFDVFRFQNGLIVEHWDNLDTVRTVQPDPVNGQTQFNGAGTPNGSAANTAANKQLITDFVNNVLIAGQWSSAPNYFNSNGDYIQHSPGVPNGIAWLAGFPDGTPFYSSLKYVYGEGDIVLSMSEGPAFSGGMPTGDTLAYYDLFRLESGKIAEHWDVVQPIPPQATWANSNGKW